VAKDEEILIIQELKNAETKEIAFEKIIRLYKERLYFHIRRMVIDHDDTNDILQDTFYKAFINIETFRFESSIFTWLYKIATSITLNFLNKKNRYPILYLSDKNTEYLTSKLEDSDFFDGDELQKKFQKAILKLPKKQQLVFNMKYYEDIKYEEMSEILGTSVGALKVSYHAAVKKIEISINED